LRTNRPALQAPHRAWRNQQSISLEYRSEDGLERQAPIVAARYVDMEEGQLLLLWLRITDEDVELELGYDFDDDSGDEGDDDPDFPDYPT
jgi:hypothetical protein